MCILHHYKRNAGTTGQKEADMKPKTKQQEQDLLGPVQDAEPEERAAQAGQTPPPRPQPARQDRPNRGRKSPDRVQKGGEVVTLDKPPLSPHQLMWRAIDAGNLDMVERMIVLQKRLDDDAAERAFSDAMCAAQREMAPVFRDAVNPETRSRYATPERLDRALRPIYSRHGFSLSFDTADGAPGGYVRVVCFVRAHGRKEQPHIDIPCDGKGPKGGDVMTKTHAVMAAVTYAKRGLLKMIFNVTETNDADDDGNTAAGIAGGRLTPEQAEELKAAIAATDVTEQKFCAVYRVEAVADLPPASFGEAIKRLKARQGK